MQLSGKELRGLFDRFTRSAFRLEAQPAYAIPDEDEITRKFLAGEPKPDGFNDDWLNMVSENKAAGKTMQRLKVVRQPFTGYTRSLFAWVIPDNVAAGEDYQILDLTDRSLDLPDQDFWIFDEQTVALLHFNGDGTLEGRELVDSPDTDQYLRWRDLALAEAVPFREYRA